MDRDSFKTQMSRLTECYGEKAYPTARQEVFWKAFSRYSEEVFGDAVTQCIGERQYAPMLKELGEAVDEAAARDRDRMRGRASETVTSVLYSAAERSKSRDLAKFCVGVITARLMKRPEDRMTDEEFAAADKQITSWILGLRKERGESAPCSKCGGDGYVRVETKTSRVLCRCDCPIGSSRPLFIQGAFGSKPIRHLSVTEFQKQEADRERA